MLTPYFLPPREIWTQCPYTNFVMYNFVALQLTNLQEPAEAWKALYSTRFRGSNGLTYSHAEAYENKKLQLTNFGRLFNAAAPIDPEGSEALWNGNSGLCTSFTIRVAYASNIAATTALGDTGMHRWGWRKRFGATSAIWIDSSSRSVHFHSSYSSSSLRSF